MKNKNVFNKIFGRSGAATLIAILVFFLAALSGTIVLTMASSNAGRYTHEKEDQQAYLSVISAAQLIIETLDGFEVTFQTDGPYSPDGSNVSVDFDTKNGQLFLGDTRFEKNLIARSLGIDLPYETISFRLSVENGSDMGSVFVTLDMSGLFAFNLWSEDGNVRDYQMTLLIPTTFDPIGSDYNTKYENGKLVYMYKTMSFNTAGATFNVNPYVPPTEED